jgi:prevent-host-death family protein
MARRTSAWHGAPAHGAAHQRSAWCANASRNRASLIMPIYGIHEAKTRLSHLVRLVERGEIVTITRAYQPVALLVRIGATPQARRPGTLRETLKLDPALDELDSATGAFRRPAPATNTHGST